jgi:hypothetical protein
MTRFLSTPEVAPSVAERPLSGPTPAPVPAQPRKKGPRTFQVWADDPRPPWFPTLEMAFDQVEQSARRARERRDLTVWVAVKRLGVSTRWLGNQLGLPNTYVGRLVKAGAAVVERDGLSGEQAEARVGLS